MSKQPIIRPAPGVSPRQRRARLTAWLLSACLASGAWAEKADRDKPINLEADKVSVDDRKQTATFEGNVVMVQGTMRITADRVIVKQDKSGVQSASAFGKPVTFKQKRDGLDEYVEAFADRAEYDGKAEKLELFNNAMLKRAQDEVRGAYISYEVDTEFFQVTGSNPQAAGAGPNVSGRVKAVFQPQQKKKDAPAGPGAAGTQPPGVASSTPR